MILEKTLHTQVCKHSIESKSSTVDVRPLKQQELRDAGWYTRPIDKLASTEFTFTRFLIPELTNFKGWAVFMDSDMILTTDIQELFDQVDDKYAVMCVQHDYKVTETTKMDGQKQTIIPCVCVCVCVCVQELVFKHGTLELWTSKQQSCNTRLC